MHMSGDMKSGESVLICVLYVKLDTSPRQVEQDRKTRSLPLCVYTCVRRSVPKDISNKEHAAVSLSKQFFFFTALSL